MYLDRDGKVQSVAYRLPAAKKKGGRDESASDDDAIEAPKARPDVTRRGMEMIGDLRTDALHEALGRAPIEDDTLLALLVLAFAGQNVSIASGNADGYARLERHTARLIDKDGKLAFERETLQQAARAVLIDILSCRQNRSDSGVVARVAGQAIGADNFLPNMGTEDFLSCLSRTALEAACNGTRVLPRPRVKDTRAELVKHFSDARFVHPVALFAPAPDRVAAWIDRYSAANADEFDDAPDESDTGGEAEDTSDEEVAGEDAIAEPADSFAVAAE